MRAARPGTRVPGDAQAPPGSASNATTQGSMSCSWPSAAERWRAAWLRRALAGRERRGHRHTAPRRARDGAVVAATKRRRDRAHRHDRRRRRRTLSSSRGVGRPPRRARRRDARAREFDQGRHPQRSGSPPSSRSRSGSPLAASPRSSAEATWIPSTSPRGCWNPSCASAQDRSEQASPVTAGTCAAGTHYRRLPCVALTAAPQTRAPRALISPTLHDVGPAGLGAVNIRGNFQIVRCVRIVRQPGRYGRSGATRTDMALGTRG